MPRTNPTRNSTSSMPVTFTEAEALCTKELRNYGIEGVITLSHKEAPFVGEIDPETKIYEVSIEEVEDLGLDKKGNAKTKTTKRSAMSLP